MLLLVALGKFRHGQVWVQPVDLRGLEVFEEETVAEVVLYARTNTTTGQNHVQDSLGQKKSYRNCLPYNTFGNNTWAGLIFLNLFVFYL